MTDETNRAEPDEFRNASSATHSRNAYSYLESDARADALDTQNVAWTAWTAWTRQDFEVLLFAAITTAFLAWARG